MGELLSLLKISENSIWPYIIIAIAAIIIALINKGDKNGLKEAKKSEEKWREKYFKLLEDYIYLESLYKKKNND